MARNKALGSGTWDTLSYRAELGLLKPPALGLAFSKPLLCSRPLSLTAMAVPQARLKATAAVRENVRVIRLMRRLQT